MKRLLCSWQPRSTSRMNPHYTSTSVTCLDRRKNSRCAGFDGIYIYILYLTKFPQLVSFTEFSGRGFTFIIWFICRKRITTFEYKKFFVLQEAENHFLIALELNPNSAEIHGNLGKNTVLNLDYSCIFGLRQSVKIYFSDSWILTILFLRLLLSFCLSIEKIYRTLETVSVSSAIQTTRISPKILR